METLKTFAASLELYGRREGVLRCIELQDYEGAIKLCRRAMHDAHHRAMYNCQPIGPEAHKENFLRIRALRTALKQFRDAKHQRPLEKPRQQRFGFGSSAN